MSVIGSLRNGFLSIPEVIHFVSLPIQPETPEHLTPYKSFLDLYYVCPMIVDLVKRDP